MSCLIGWKLTYQETDWFDLMMSFSTYHTAEIRQNDAWQYRVNNVSINGCGFEWSSIDIYGINKIISLFYVGMLLGALVTSIALRETEITLRP